MAYFHVLTIYFAILTSTPSSSESGELIQVVTPENQRSDPKLEIAVKHSNSTFDEETEDSENSDGDSYLRAYRELHGTKAERRNPHDSFEDNRPYSTVVHSSYIEDDFYPELNYKASHSHRPYKHHLHSSPHVLYGPPSPVAFYRPESVSSHHTVIGIPVSSPFHAFSSVLAKFGFHKITKLLLKIVVLKMILKFVGIITLFLVVPYLVPKNKDKNDDDERLMDTLNQMTNIVWNGISDNEEQGGEEGEAEYEEGDEKEEEGMEILEKIVKDEKESSEGPDKGTAVSVVRLGVTALNHVLGVMLSILKAKNNNMDTLDSMMLGTLSKYLKHLVKMWKK